MDGMRIDWGDGVSAIDRTSRSVVMVTDAAVGRLLRLGYRREEIEIVTDDPDPDNPLVLLHVTLRGKEVYRVVFIPDPHGPIGLMGQWVVKVKGRGWRRLLFWRH